MSTFTPTTGSGLDQLTSLITDDNGLQRRISDQEISDGAAAANAMNAILVKAIQETGVAQNGQISAADVYAINSWIRDESHVDENGVSYLQSWIDHHGDDEAGEETGFHLVQNDGANSRLFGRNAVNTVADGIYHLGFEIENGRLLNEDGDQNASVKTIASWLNDLMTEDLDGTEDGKGLDLIDETVANPYDQSTTGSGLDQLTDIITNDERLQQRISLSDITEGAQAADAMNEILITAIRETGMAQNGTFSTADVRSLSDWIADPANTNADGTSYKDLWIAAHGDDEDGEETGFHLVQNDGARTTLYGRNAVNNVADGIYHLGFGYKGDRLINEDGNANVRLSDVANWLTDLMAEDLDGTEDGDGINLIDETVLNPYRDLSTTGSGLDQLTDIITHDQRLEQKISLDDINDGAKAANAMNTILVKAIQETGVAQNGQISAADVYAINSWIRDESNVDENGVSYLQSWIDHHGDDEDGEETGFHLVQNDGANSRLFGRNAVNTVADGIYHLGFEIEKGRLLNEDGDKNASVKTIASWLNDLMAEDLDGSEDGEGLDLIDEAVANPYDQSTTGSGLDQLTDIITNDERLQQRISLGDITEGAQAADTMNEILITAIRETGVAQNGTFSTADVRSLSDWIADPANTNADGTSYKDLWIAAHGDDEDGEETGFHLVQNDGARTTLYGRNAVNNVADGIYHLGFGYKGDRLINEDGNANVRLSDVANWLTDLMAEDLDGTEDGDGIDLIDEAVLNPYRDLSTTGSGLDRLTDVITHDQRLEQKISLDDINDGAKAANAMNAILVKAIQETGVAQNGQISAADVYAINGWIRDESNVDENGVSYLQSWIDHHGDDEDGEETGFHLVQNDGANSRLFGRNAVNTVADGIYHLGFEIENGRLLNEDGDKNASVKTIASWLNDLMAEDLDGSEDGEGLDLIDEAVANPYDQSTTGSGLDQLTDIITNDESLQQRISLSDITEGAAAADAMNEILITAMRETGVAADGSFSSEDVRNLSDWITDTDNKDADGTAYHALWIDHHGDDEDTIETGFHLVQNDGARTTLYGRNAVNTVADGIYHIGIGHEDNRLINEDGNANARLSDVADWLNELMAEDLNGSLDGTGIDLIGVESAPNSWSPEIAALNGVDPTEIRDTFAEAISPQTTMQLAEPIQMLVTPLDEDNMLF